MKGTQKHIIMENAMKFDFGSYQITYAEKNINGKNYFTAVCEKATPKAKYLKSKVVFAYRFYTQEQRAEYVANWKAGKEKMQADKEARKQAKLDAKKNMINPFKVGDIVYDSWGWEQTNIDFYQIVEVGEKSVKMRRICEEVTRDGGFMCEFVRPAKDKFVEDAPVETKILQVLKDGTVYIKSRHGWISKWDESQKEVYQSHYA